MLKDTGLNSLKQNLLLRALKDELLAEIQPSMEWVSLQRDDCLTAPFERPDHAYFPANGFASVVATGPNDCRAETGMIGPEGVSAIPIILANEGWLHETFIQHAGHGFRMKTEDLEAAMSKHPALQMILQSYILTFITQLACTALAKNYAKLEERLARWLLMADDRVQSDDGLHIAHRFLASMLGVRRPGVTVALHVLEGKALIRNERARIVILDRNGLKEHANGYYGTPEDEFARLIGYRIHARSLKSE